MRYIPSWLGDSSLEQWGHEFPTSFWLLSTGHPLKVSLPTTWSHFPYFDIGTCFQGVFCFFFFWHIKQHQNLIIYNIQISVYGCLGGSDGEEFTWQCRWRPGFDPWVGKIPWRREWQPLQYSCVENPMDRTVWRSIVHGVTKSRTWLSNFLSLMIATFFF